MALPLKILIGLLLFTGGWKGGADDVPVAPISTTHLAEWGEVYEITTRKVTLIVSPSAGGIVSLHQSGIEEALPAALICKAMEEPPPEAPRWESRAWRTSEGRQVVMLHRNLPHPYDLRIVHVIELSATGDSFRQSTRFTGLGPGAHSFLAPAFEAVLPLPDAPLQKEETPIQLEYGTMLSSWNFLWKLEQPEINLENSLRIREAGNRLSLSSRPAEEMDLPPQGWTLLCSLEIFWSQKPD